MSSIESTIMLTSAGFSYCKRALRAIAGQDHLLTRDKVIERERIGSDYGGWVVASGPLRAVRPVVLSFGLGDDISFDQDMISRYGAQVYAFDPTDESLAWLSRQPLPKQMRVYPIGISNTDGKQTFTLPEEDRRGNFSAKASEGRAIELPVMRYASILSMLGVSRVDVLKLDIEGSEYEVIPDVLNSAVRPTQLLVEFHHRIHRITVVETLATVRLLRESGYSLFDVSPGGRELSFIRSRLD